VGKGGAPGLVGGYIARGFWGVEFGGLGRPGKRGKGESRLKRIPINKTGSAKVN